MNRLKTKMRWMCLGIIFTTSFFLTSCKYLGLGSTKDPVEVTTDKPKSEDQAAEAASPESLELKIAKLWAMHDELADQVQSQKQRLAVIEKGLMLGIIPEELKMEGDRNSEPKSKKMPKKEAKNTPSTPLASAEAPTKQSPPAQAPVPEQKPIESVANVNTNSEEKPRHEKLQDAQRYFEQGQYGRALAIYSTIDDAGDGSHHYWMGLCWYKLKELNTAKSEFETLLKVAPASALIPRAKYQLAKIDFETGFKEKALAQLRQIVESYPNEDAAQMARTTLQSMESQL